MKINMSFFSIFTSLICSCGSGSSGSDGGSGGGDSSSEQKTISEALNSELSWTAGFDLSVSTEEAATWTGSHDDTLSEGDGVAARSGAIQKGESSWIETTVEGPAKVSFWWKNSWGTFTHDSMEFLHNDAVVASSNKFDGPVVPKEWKKVDYDLSVGSHTLRWRHSIKSTDKEGEIGGTIWLEGVTVTPTKSFTEVLDSPDLEWVSDTLTVAEGCIDEGECVKGYGQITTTLVGPGKITFWIRVSSKYNYPDGFFNFTVKDNESSEEEISDRYRADWLLEWKEMEFEISEGTKEFTIAFPKKNYQENIGWLDKVTYTPQSQ